MCIIYIHILMEYLIYDTHKSSLAWLLSYPIIYIHYVSYHKVIIHIQSHMYFYIKLNDKCHISNNDKMGVEWNCLMLC